MGYRIEYHLRLQTYPERKDVSKKIFKTIEAELESLPEFYSEKFFSCEGSFDLGLRRWCSEEGDMLALSKKHPNILFDVLALGNDGVRWEERWLNGMVQICIAEPLPFDPAQLKEPVEAV